MNCPENYEELESKLKIRQDLKHQIILFGVTDLRIIRELHEFGVAAAILAKLTPLYTKGYTLPHLICFWGHTSAVSKMKDLWHGRFKDEEIFGYSNVSSLVKKEPLDLLLEYLEILEKEQAGLDL
ncbi:MAG: hypothetical protein ACJ77K_00805 [Bacteroidia bacterium]